MHWLGDPLLTGMQVQTPEGLTALNLDIIRLTAQMVARNGKKFLRCTACLLLPFPHTCISALLACQRGLVKLL